MVRKRPIYDVFVSYSSGDREVAEEIAEQLREAGITAFVDSRESAAGTEVADAVWEAIAESRALVAVLSEREVSQNLGVEIGAAAAWNKPVFIVLNAPPSTRLPPLLRTFPVFPRSRISDLVRRVESLQVPLADDAIEALRSAYVDVGVPTDQLSSSPGALQQLTKQVNQRTSSTHSGETLLRELLRLRKRGQLPRLSNRQAAT